MSIIMPIVGLRYGMLTVISGAIFHLKNKDTAYMCRCECGSERAYGSHALRKGWTKSCGCKRQENFYKAWKEYYESRPSIETKGLRGTYSSWLGLRHWCLNHKEHAYKDYGGRGITVCDRWRDSFQNFLDDMGVRPKDLSIGRIDNDGNYEPGNCRWETDKQQANNTRRTIKIEGEPLVHFCERVGADAGVVRHRLKAGWDLETAMVKPLFRPKDDIHVGDRFGRLVIVSDKPGFLIYKNREKTSGIKKHRAFLCRCDCGVEKLVVADKLRHGKRKSCGCINNPTP